jgi:hypothetical protein
VRQGWYRDADMLECAPAILGWYANRDGADASLVILSEVIANSTNTPTSRRWLEDRDRRVAFVRHIQRFLQADSRVGAPPSPMEQTSPLHDNNFIDPTQAPLPIPHRPCPAGTYANEVASWRCTPCAAGSYQSQVRQAGHSSPKRFTNEYLPLTMGRLQTGQSRCDQCPLGKSTNDTGKTSATACVDEATLPVPPLPVITAPTNCSDLMSQLNAQYGPGFLGPRFTNDSLGDGYCSKELNNEICNWDGGGESAWRSLTTLRVLPVKQSWRF